MAEVFLDDGQVKLIHGHVLDALKLLPDESVQCVITSPPYWALRSYQTEAQVWGGATDPNHACLKTGHSWSDLGSSTSRVRNGAKGGLHDGRDTNGLADAVMLNPSQGNQCVMCGAWRGELGHEPTPQMYVAHLVDIFRDVRRVLKPDGVVFCNLGDSYAGSGRGPQGENGVGQHSKRQGFEGGTDSDPRGKRKNKTDAPEGTRAKSLVLIPERFSIAMEDDGWIVRSRIAWCKRTPMPESVTDRPTSAWEHIWMFAKEPRYFWDQEAVRERLAENTLASNGIGDDGKGYPWKKNIPVEAYGIDHFSGNMRPGASRSMNPAGRNMWNYWLLSPDPEPLAHFATFPKEIPRRCIAAATSEKGECPKCGNSWVRVVERNPTRSNQSVWNGSGENIRKGESRPGNFVDGSATTTGWAPQCNHDLPPVPSTVLDPFVGSGTTTMVARSMLRRSIGIDLSETYLHDIALKKNAQMALMAEPETA